MSKKGLGKGLGNLFDNDDIPDFSEEHKPEPEQTSEMPINLIEPNRDQPRKSFDTEQLNILAKSVAENGVIQPITVSPQKNGRYIIVAGERRWRAAKKAGLTSIPAVVREYTNEQIAAIALIENLQREDLNPIEEALGYKNLTENFMLTQEQIGQRVGKSRSAITNSMRLLALSDNIQQLLINGDISGGHARALLAVEDEKFRQELADEIIKNNLNVRQAEEMAKKINKPKRKPPSQKIPEAYTAEINRLQDKLSSDFGTKVKILHGEKRGKIEIEYYGNDDLDRILSLISKNPE